MRLLMFFTVIGALVLPGCTRRERTEERRDEKQAAPQVDTNAHQNRVDYERTMDQRLTKLDQELDELRGKARQAKGNLKDEYNQQIAELERERSEARSKFGELKSATDDAWDKLKDGADKAAAKLEQTEQTYNRTLERMKTNH